MEKKYREDFPKSMNDVLFNKLIDELLAKSRYEDGEGDSHSILVQKIIAESNIGNGSSNQDLSQPRFLVEIFRMANRVVIPSGLLVAVSENYGITEGRKTKTIATRKLRRLLLDNIDVAKLTRSETGELIYVGLPKRLLLDSDES